MLNIDPILMLVGVALALVTMAIGDYTNRMSDFMEYYFPSKRTYISLVCKKNAWSRSSDGEKWRLVLGTLVYLIIIRVLYLIAAGIAHLILSGWLFQNL